MRCTHAIKLFILFTLTSSLMACVSTKTVSSEQVDDTQLGCASLATRIGEVRGGRDYAKANRGLSGSNVMAALFFLPALVVNNNNTADMIKSMDEREGVLTGLYEKNECSDEIPTYDTKEMKKKLKSGDTLETFS